MGSQTIHYIQGFTQIIEKEVMVVVNITIQIILLMVTRAMDITQKAQIAIG